MMNKKAGQVLLRVSFVATLVVFITSLGNLILGDLSGNGRRAYALIAISSFFISVSFFLQLKQKRRANNGKSDLVENESKR